MQIRGFNNGQNIVMVQENKLRKRLRTGETVFGPFLKLADPAIIEIAGSAGFDFAIIDTEHGPLSIESAQNLVRAAENKGITPIIRVLNNDHGSILRALDIGAHGVQVPQVSTEKQARNVVAAVKFFPEGERGVCRFVRAAEYSSMDKFEYFKAANRETVAIIHVEGIEGINNLPDILTVEGLDVVFLGPYDLSQACGVTGQVDHPKVVEKMQSAVNLAREKNIAVGTFVESSETAEMWINLGVQYISYSVDVGIFFSACANILDGLKRVAR